MFDVPHHGRALCRRATTVRPRQSPVRVDRRPPDGRLREVSRQQGLPRPQVRLMRRLPPRAASTGVRTGLHLVPRDRHVEDPEVRPCADRVSAQGRPRRRTCTACHVKPPTQVRLQAKACRDCHSDVHAGQFKQDCGSCHTQVTFKKAPFEHDTATRFPLAGKHAALACSRCHKGAATTGAVRTIGTGATVDREVLGPGRRPAPRVTTTSIAARPARRARVATPRRTSAD